MPWHWDRIVGLDVPGLDREHHRGLGLAGVEHGILPVEHCGELGRGELPVGRAGDRQPVPDGELGDDRFEGGDVAAVTVQHEQALEALPDRRFAHAAHHRLHGREVQRDRAAERDMVLRHAERDHRRHDDRLVRGDEASGSDRGLVRQPVIDHDGQMRPVLLGRADGDDDDGVLVGEGAQLRCPKPRPFDGSHRWTRGKRDGRRRRPVGLRQSDGKGSIGMSRYLRWSRSSSSFMVL